MKAKVLVVEDDAVIRMTLGDRLEAEGYAVEFARKGGRARAKHLSPERRREIARKAVLARWARQKAKGNPEGP